MNTKIHSETRYFKLLEDDRGIRTLIFDTPESAVNVLTHAALEEFDDHLDNLLQDSRVKALFIESGKEDIFIAGADIHEIQAADDKTKITALVRQGQDIFTKGPFKNNFTF